MKIDDDRIVAELEKLAEFSDAPPPAVTRVVYSEQDLRAREYIKELCLAAGLAVREDAVGNTFARWNGSDTELAAIGTAPSPFTSEDFRAVHPRPQRRAP